MKRDISLAILIGLVFGVCAAFVVIFLPNLKGSKKTEVAVSVSPTPVESQTISDGAVSLEIKKPEPDSIFSVNSTTLEGIARESKIVMIDSDNDTTIIESTGSGTFSQKLSLSQGANKFIVTSYNDKGDSSSKVLTVFYIPEKS